MLTKILPSHLHVTAIGIGSALGAGGSTVFPIAAGEIANSRGITTIPPLLLGMFAAELVLLCWLPGLPAKTPGRQASLEEIISLQFWR
ncbi:hypothetical protein B9Z19DRAFT_15193 [Tuber borchii]|uniref:Major facilitator superfamily (MFS) profile domain-containing protein n=1 Tax=Tuber borchii TaxID=42251 RepID=A0A2T7A736_TUBBO|nr:hypothetical protein B9Z19DRAFT_15193 [Tuber borchii]